MPGPVRAYVRLVDRTNRIVGRVVVLMIFAMMGMLLFSALSRGLFSVSYVWVVEMAQFLLTAYYMLGGGYSLQLDAHVRMDLFYGRLSIRAKATLDAVTSLLVIFYLGVLLWGGFSSTAYAIKYGQKNFSAWAPPLWPIKVIMVVGITLMLLQMIAAFLRDLAAARGEPIE